MPVSTHVNSAQTLVLFIHVFGARGCADERAYVQMIPAPSPPPVHVQPVELHPIIDHHHVQPVWEPFPEPEPEPEPMHVEVSPRGKTETE